MNQKAYFFLRLPVAISLLGHGLVRLPKLQAFALWMTSSMEDSILPAQMITAWGFILPFLETLIGFFLLAGIKTEYTIYAALTLMSILIFGSASVENWSAIEAQLIHSIYLLGLLWYREKMINKKAVTVLKH